MSGVATAIVLVLRLFVQMVNGTGKIAGKPPKIKLLVTIKHKTNLILVECPTIYQCLRNATGKVAKRGSEGEQSLQAMFPLLKLDLSGMLLNKNDFGILVIVISACFAVFCVL